MLTDAELQTLYDDIESDRVERKESVADPKKIQQAICAFSNDMPGHNEPGVLFVGVKDDGSCANLTIDDQLLLTLSQLKMTAKLLPPPSMTVQKRTFSGCEVAIVVVEPSNSPPVRFDGRTWIRVGPQRSVATREDETRLIERRRSKDIPYDLYAVEQATIADLDVDFFRSSYLPSAVAADVIAENKRPVEQQLAALGFVSADQITPTVAGMLALGDSPSDFLPGAYVQFVRIQGTELHDPIIDRREVYGPISDLIRKTEETVRANIQVHTDITSGPLEIASPDYPIVAIEQLFRNAIMHRSYQGTNAPIRLTWFSDRIEILSPGGPYGKVTIANFGTRGIADYRNPTIAEAMRNQNFVQQFGAGIPIAQSAMDKNGNPPPEWEPIDTFVRITLRSNR